MARAATAAQASARQASEAPSAFPGRYAVRMVSKLRWFPVRPVEKLRDLLATIVEWIAEQFRGLTGALRRQAVLANMVEADIILASPKTLRLSPVALAYRVLLRAKYVHSMLYLGDGTMLHTTTHHGVVIGPVPRAIFRRDRYAVYRAPGLRAKDRLRVVREAVKLRTMKLDHPGLVTNIPARLLALRRPLIQLEKNRLWCSKLIERAYGAAGIELVPPEQKGTVTSDDLSHSSALIKI